MAPNNALVFKITRHFLSTMAPRAVNESKYSVSIRFGSFATLLAPNTTPVLSVTHHFLSTMTPNSSLLFKVTRRESELVAPTKPTSHEYVPLSDIDDQEVVQFQLPVIQFYRNDPSINAIRRDPAKVIKEAIARTLVYYYPFAGRLREVGPNRKLIVDCTGEGVIFTEASADVTLEQFGDALHPPFPFLDQLLYDIPDSNGIIDCPLLAIQVTSLKCGSFIFAIRFNHTMSDGAGMVQFMSAVGEMARGASAPSIRPVWQRELLMARDSPCVTCTHHEYDQVDNTKGNIFPLEDMAHRSFFFGPAEVSKLRRFLPPQLRTCSTFEVLTAFLWRCRTIALQLDPSEEVRLICIVNARSKFNPPLPDGYYGNAIAFPVALTTADELYRNPLGYALELVRKTKNVVTEEYMKAVADLMVLKGRSFGTAHQIFVVSDLRWTGFGDVDFGWGKAAYGGPAKGGVGVIPGVASFYIPSTDGIGEKGIVVPICLPTSVMERFVGELDIILKMIILRQQPTPLNLHYKTNRTC